MTRLLATLSSILMLAVLARAQTANTPNEGSKFVHHSGVGTFTLSWWGRTGITYFIQQSGDLVTWEYLPVIESGANEIIAYGFASPSANKYFFRLKSTDAPTTNPFAADFDGDKVSNYQELLNGTDPFHSVDSDHDDLPDHWERANFRQIGLADLRYGANDDTDGDGITNLAEFTANTSPVDPAPAITLASPGWSVLVP